MCNPRMNTVSKLLALIVSILVIVGVCHPVFAEGFKKYPYLQHVTPDGITICWEIAEHGDTTNPESQRVLSLFPRR